MKNSRLQSRLTEMLVTALLISPNAYADSTMSNLASIEQVGNGYHSTVSQSGDGNTAHSHQITNGADLEETLHEGNGTIEITQTGSLHYAEIYDFGKSNDIAIHQGQSGNNAQISLAGNHNELMATQSGDYNSAVADIDGSYNQVDLMQSGYSNNSDIQINGDLNNLAVVQDGNALSFSLEINGDGRDIAVTQYGN